MPRISSILTTFLPMTTSQKFNAGALMIAFGLFCYSFASATPVMLVGTAQVMFAQAVGASASVEPNPINTYMRQLREKETELTEREKRIAYLEERQGQSDTPTDPWALASFGTSIMLFGAVGLNFYFDRKRGRLFTANPFSINLKQRG